MLLSVALSCRGNSNTPHDRIRPKLHVQCNEAQCSQGLKSISKCLNTFLTILFFSFSSSSSGLCSGHISLFLSRILAVQWTSRLKFILKATGGKNQLC